VAGLMLKFGSKQKFMLIAQMFWMTIAESSIYNGKKKETHSTEQSI
jgi:hypothetical protein